MEKECVFCKIARGEIPSMKVYEDDLTLVFMDIAKDVDGHMLAIPKKHCKSILDCDGETFANLLKTVKKVSENCVQRSGYSGVNLLNASGESAGQSVPHFHIHIIPRSAGDGINAWPNFSGAENEIADIHKKLRID